MEPLKHHLFIYIWMENSLKLETQTDFRLNIAANHCQTVRLLCFRATLAGILGFYLAYFAN